MPSIPNFDHDLLDYRAHAAGALEDLHRTDPNSIDPDRVAAAGTLALAYATLDVGTQLAKIHHLLDERLEDLLDELATPPDDDDVLEEVHPPPDSKRVGDALSRLTAAVRYHLGVASVHTQEGFVVTTKAAFDRLDAETRYAEEVRR